MRIEASRIPSASACSRSASKRALVSRGRIRPPPASISRYSRITGESNSVEPSSRMSTGTLPSGFCRLIGSAGSWVEAGSTLTLPSRPSTLMAMRALRPNGGPKPVRRVTMGQRCPSWPPPAPSTIADKWKSRQSAARQRGPVGAQLTGDDEIYGLGAFAFLIGLDIEGDPLSFIQRFEPGPLDRRDMHENVTPPVIRLDEAVATF